MHLNRYPRLAVFADTIDETTIQLNAFAGRHGLPLLVVQARRYSTAKRALAEFAPDVIHAVHPGHVGLLGTYCAQSLRIPLVVSWHANLPAERVAEQILLRGLYCFPGVAQLLLAPNPDIEKTLQRNTGLPTHLIPPAVDPYVFAPCKRLYADGVVRIGYAGSLSSERNVRALVSLQQSLRENRTRPFRFLIVGNGSERAWLQKNLNGGEFTGNLEGEFLARAIARMDIFAYTPDNDVSGDTVMKAMASGVATVAMSKGAPRFLIEDGVSGFLSQSKTDFNRHVLTLLTNRELRRRIAINARARSIHWSWADACEALYRAYRLAVRSFDGPRTRLPMIPPGPIGMRPAV